MTPTKNKLVRCNCGAWLHQKHDCKNPGPKLEPGQASTTPAIARVPSHVLAWLEERRDLIVSAVARPGLWAKIAENGPLPPDVTPLEAAAYMVLSSPAPQLVEDGIPAGYQEAAARFIAKLAGTPATPPTPAPAPTPAEAEPTVPAQVVTFLGGGAANAYALPSAAEAVAFARGFQLGSAALPELFAGDEDVADAARTTRAFALASHEDVVEMVRTMPPAEVERVVTAAGYQIGYLDGELALRPSGTLEPGLRPLPPLQPPTAPELAPAPAASPEVTSETPAQTPSANA